MRRPATANRIDLAEVPCRPCARSKAPRSKGDVSVGIGSSPTVGRGVQARCRAERSGKAHREAYELDPAENDGRDEREQRGEAHERGPVHQATELANARFVKVMWH